MMARYILSTTVALAAIAAALLAIALRPLPAVGTPR